MLYWLSFVDDEKHLGCAVVQAETEIDAISHSHMLGCNPGGEVMALEIPVGDSYKVKDHLNSLKSSQEWANIFNCDMISTTDKKVIVSPSK